MSVFNCGQLWSAMLPMLFWLVDVCSQLSATLTMPLWLDDESVLCLLGWMHMEHRHRAQEPTGTSFAQTIEMLGPAM